MSDPLGGHSTTFGLENLPKVSQTTLARHDVAHTCNHDGKEASLAPKPSTSHHMVTRECDEGGKVSGRAPDLAI